MSLGELLTRPRARPTSAGGLLAREHFQIAYVTTDLTRARDLFATRFGIERFATMSGALPGGGTMDVALAWSGGTMYELIEASGPGSALFSERLPAGEFRIMPHHLGFLLADDGELDSLKEEASASGYKVLAEGGVPGFLYHCYLDVPDLGQIHEYARLGPEGRAFFESVPGG
jgi:hypothetical protein